MWINGADAPICGFGVGCGVCVGWGVHCCFVFRCMHIGSSFVYWFFVCFHFILAFQFWWRVFGEHLIILFVWVLFIYNLFIYLFILILLVMVLVFCLNVLGGVCFFVFFLGGFVVV